MRHYTGKSLYISIPSVVWNTETVVQQFLLDIAVLLNIKYYIQTNHWIYYTALPTHGQPRTHLNYKTYCFMHSGMPTYSMGMSSASSARVKTYLIFWLNFELWKNKCRVQLQLRKYPLDQYSNSQTFKLLKRIIASILLPNKRFCDGQKCSDEPRRMNYD